MFGHSNLKSKLFPLSTSPVSTAIQCRVYSSVLSILLVGWGYSLSGPNMAFGTIMQQNGAVPLQMLSMHATSPNRLLSRHFLSSRFAACDMSATEQLSPFFYRKVKVCCENTGLPTSREISDQFLSGSCVFLLQMSQHPDLYRFSQIQARTAAPVRLTGLQVGKRGRQHA